MSKTFLYRKIHFPANYIHLPQSIISDYSVMQQHFDAKKNYEETRQTIGYVPRKQATQKDYDRIGFMSGTGSSPATENKT